MGDKNPDDEATASELHQQLLKHALAFATAHQYSANPKLLELHQSMRFDQMPPDSFSDIDPAAEVIGLIVTYSDPQYGGERGRYYIPSNSEV